MAICTYETEPAKPPFPMPRNFPFQPSAGIQTSLLIVESADGFSVSATRQKGTATFSAAPSGGVKEPAGTDSAAVTLAWSRVDLARSLHAASAVIACVGKDASVVARAPATTNRV